ncbi:MAG: hypothetical protein ACLP4W_09940 [Mycobacterium sp.]|uniref:hypothetical protein n=1 Tax=Mycobacterium sp. TaxID=1785 RepID=UPI003F9BD74A
MPLPNGEAAALAKGTAAQSANQQVADTHSVAAGTCAVLFEVMGRDCEDVLVFLQRFDATAVAVIRTLPAWARHWDAATRVWYIHPGVAGTPADRLARIGYRINDIGIAS